MEHTEFVILSDAHVPKDQMKVYPTSDGKSLAVESNEGLRAATTILDEAGVMELVAFCERWLNDRRAKRGTPVKENGTVEIGGKKFGADDDVEIARAIAQEEIKKVLEDLQNHRSVASAMFDTMVKDLVRDEVPNHIDTGSILSEVMDNLDFDHIVDEVKDRMSLTAADIGDFEEEAVRAVKNALG